jgi:hypothetical protein
MSRPRRPSLREMELEVENWNLKHPVGTPVRVRLDDGQVVHTATISKAEMLSGHTPVIWLEHIRGCYLLSRVTPCPPGGLEEGA